MKTASPGRESLIAGGALIALYGYEMETIATLRAHKVPNWNERAELVHCRNLAESIRKGEPIVQEDTAVKTKYKSAHQPVGQ